MKSTEHYTCGRIRRGATASVQAHLDFVIERARLGRQERAQLHAAGGGPARVRGRARAAAAAARRHLGAAALCEATRSAAAPGGAAGASRTAPAPPLAAATRTRTRPRGAAIFSAERQIAAHAHGLQVHLPAPSPRAPSRGLSENCNRSTGWAGGEEGSGRRGAGAGAHLHAAHAARGDLPRVPPERLQRAGSARARAAHPRLRPRRALCEFKAPRLSPVVNFLFRDCAT